MKPISEVISGIINKLANTNGYKKALLERYWVDLVGEGARKHSRPRKIDKRILYVSVDSSVWNQALFIDKANLIRRINRKFTRPIVEEIKYQMGQFDILAIDQAESEEVLQTINTILAEPEAVAKVREITEIWNRRVLLSMVNKKTRIAKIKRKYGR